MQTSQTQIENVLQPDVSFGRKTCANHANMHKLLFPQSQSEFICIYNRYYIGNKAQEPIKGKCHTWTAKNSK